MGKLIVIRLEEGSFKNGFQVVNLQIAEDGQPFHHQPKTTSLPADPELDEFYENLKKHGFIHNLNGWKPSSDSFKKLLNKWLESSSFLPKWNEILTDCTSQDIIRVVLQTQDPELAKLPWHLWNFFENHPLAEIAFSLPEYKVQPCYSTRTEARILAILGDSSKIDLTKDEEELKQLSPKTCFLAQKDQETIFWHLNDEESWDILFFAGHSKTSGEKGILSINNQKDSVKIDDLEYAVRAAISKGLRLAIFNSCDGLGLARTLASWNVPQVIVMRQPIYDDVAQKFLKDFLKAFVGGKTLYLALREARENLQGLEGQYGLASWLPVMYDQSFAVDEGSLTWKQLPKQSKMRGTPLNNSNDPYIERPPLEQTCYDYLEQRGIMIIRIKAPQKMGKAQLMRNVFDYAKRKNYLTVLLNFRQPTEETISNYDTFLQWFCNKVCQELKLESIEASEHWKSAKGDDNAKIDSYFDQYILPNVNNNQLLVLGLHSIDRVFPFSFASNFLTLLRSWHGTAQINDDWGKLRLFLAPSTEDYVELPIEQSPFNVGEDIKLPEFTYQQIHELSLKHEIELNQNQIDKLMSEIGGHPYLINKLITYLKNSQKQQNNKEYCFEENISLKSLLKRFEQHLEKIWEQLKKSEISDLMIEAIKDLLKGRQPINNEKVLFHLDSLGLIKKEEPIDFRNNLYREYLSKKLDKLL
jgi:AAA-like domain/CHAT domain